MVIEYLKLEFGYYLVLADIVATRKDVFTANVEKNVLLKLKQGTQVLEGPNYDPKVQVIYLNRKKSFCNHLINLCHWAREKKKIKKPSNEGEAANSCQMHSN